MICIPTRFPGGPDSVISESFEDAELFDFYEVHPDGNFEHTVQSRPCACWGPDQVEAVARRGIDAIIVAGMSSSALMRFRASGVRILRADNPSVTALLDSCSTGRLVEIGMDKSSKSGKADEEV
jgi:predicted Fe-Mo cluster-binding NifX family protein